MKIELQNIGKRFGREWIFRGIDLTIEPGTHLAITGSNGAGKSTMLKIISSYITPSEGTVNYHEVASEIKDEPQLTFNYAAPYFNVIEEYTLKELINLHSKFKKAYLNIDGLIESSGLNKAYNKNLKDFSSGMKQRVKLILALAYESEVILLDEPTSNLDIGGINWFKNLITTQYQNKTVVIASNLEEEISLCDNNFHIR